MTRKKNLRKYVKNHFFTNNLDILPSIFEKTMKFFKVAKNTKKNMVLGHFVNLT